MVSIGLQSRHASGEQTRLDGILCMWHVVMGGRDNWGFAHPHNPWRM